MGSIFIWLRRMLPKAGSSKEETGAPCHRSQLLDGAVSVEWIALISCRTQEPELWDMSWVQGAWGICCPSPGSASPGFLAVFLLPWCSISQEADPLSCGMSPRVTGAAKLLAFSVTLFLVTRLWTVFSICYLIYLQGKTMAKMIRLIVLTNGA